MNETPQWQLMIQKFQRNNGVLLTSDFRNDPHLYNEWRRAMCELDKKGYTIQRQRITPKLWRYELIQTDADGQTHLPLCI